MISMLKHMLFAKFTKSIDNFYDKYRECEACNIIITLGPSHNFNDETF